VRGLGRSSGAVTVVNALPTGVGCAIGIQRYVTASVDLERSDRSSLKCDPSESSTPLVRAAVATGLEKFGEAVPFRATIRLRSELPVAKGLKSSSAVATSILLSVAGAFRAAPTSSDLAQLAADVNRAVGLSATGAFDDALAGLRSGFVLTDNRRDCLLAVTPAPAAWTAVVYLPPGVHPPSPQWKSRFEVAAEEGQRIVESARAGDFAAAMRRNSDLVESVMGYDFRRLRERMQASGAVAVGVSGLGPALVALVPHDRSSEVLAALPTDVGERFISGLTAEGET
jgi:shikimate kinase